MEVDHRGERWDPRTCELFFFFFFNRLHSISSSNNNRVSNNRDSNSRDSNSSRDRQQPPPLLHQHLEGECQCLEGGWFPVT